MRRQFSGFKRTRDWHVRNGAKEKRFRDEAAETDRLESLYGAQLALRVLGA